MAMTWRRTASAGLLALAASLGPMTVAAVELSEPVSPWVGDFWREGSPEMKQYICRHAKLVPVWCDQIEKLAKPENPTPEEPYGPLLTADDARWLRLLGQGSLDGFTAEEVAFVQKRAEESGDPDAMELLGYLHARGLGVRRDPATAYIWYGRAHLRGHGHVRGNMDILWQEILAHDPAAAQRITQLFEAEAVANGAEGKD